MYYRVTDGLEDDRDRYDRIMDTQKFVHVS